MVDFIEIQILILLTLANIFAALGILFLLGRNRIKNTIFGWISEYKNLFLDELNENPKIIEQIVTPALKSLAKQYGVPEPGGRGSGTVNLFGLKLPRELLEFGIRAIAPQAERRLIEASPFG